MKYNLIEEKWIPIINLNEKHEKVSIKEILLNAHLYREIYHENHIIEFSLYRLLLVLIQRIFEEDFDYESLIRGNKFDCNKIDKYLNKWHDRFYLFHEKYPFFQTNEELLKTKKSVSYMIIDKPSGNNECFFDHTEDKDDLKITYDQTACYLITEQFFAKNSGGGGKGSPVRKSYKILAKGKNLYLTFVCNILQDPVGAIPTIDEKKLDYPAWESECISNNINGFYQVLTFLPRKIKIIDNGNYVSDIYYQQNKFDKIDVLDPLSPKKSSKDNFYNPKLNDQLWKESYLLVDENLSSQNIKNIRDYCYDDFIPVDIYGIIFGGTTMGEKIDSFHKISQSIPIKYLRDESYLEVIIVNIEYTNNIIKILKQSLKKLALLLNDNIDFYYKIEKYFNIFWVDYSCNNQKAVDVYRHTIENIVKSNFELSLISLENKYRDYDKIIRCRRYFYGQLKKRKEENING